LGRVSFTSHFSDSIFPFSMMRFPKLKPKVIQYMSNSNPKKKKRQLKNTR